MSHLNRLDASTDVDVLIVGEGIAGCSAAITATEAGARVMIVDKAPANVRHGNTAFSGAAFRRVCAEYSRDAYLNDLIRLSGSRADPELARFVVDRSREAQEWLEALGVRWSTETRDATETAEPEGQPSGRGPGLAAVMRNAIKARSIPTMHETEVVDLIHHDGAIRGVRIRSSDGAQSELRAGAVVLACGGFSANPEMVVQYIGEGARHLVLRGSPYNTGDGLRLAAAAGAKLDWMDDFHGGIIHYSNKTYHEQGLESGMRHVANYEVGILVNAAGHRFVDEGEYPSLKTYAKFGKIIPLTQPSGYAFVVYDATMRDTIDPCYDGPEKEPLQANRLEDLAVMMSVPVEAFLKTVRGFNEGIHDGASPAADPPKTQFAYPIAVPPFFAMKVTGGFTFTYGGLRTRVTGEVMDASGRMIPGLFAAGEITTGLFFGNYAGGSSLPKCTILGRMAGEAAAQHAQLLGRT